MPEPDQTRLIAAIRDALNERGMSQRQLGAEVGTREGNPDGYPQSSVAEWLAGKVYLRPDRVFTIERVLSMRPGTLSKLDGYIPVGADPVVTPEEALEADPDLSPVFRELIAATIAQARTQTRSARQRKRALR